MKKLMFAGISCLLLSGCATVSMLPKDAATVDFGSVEGKTGWSQYQQVENFNGYNADQIYDAAKIGLGNAGFSLRVADKAKGVVIGEHGMTAHDWNVISGVYFKSIEGGTQVKIITEGSKDIGFSGDVTSDGWPGKILKGMREHLNNTYQSILKIDRSDLK
ncbi:hypothetical protein HXZ93_01615 [Acinetobacter pseudolwoffii]|uniref:hypothetical protein n=1 Tax=Acinetobacter pseudolwoffii TaxID=2053287 RepID=UPI00257851FE|nr:hypothetical protein [Acinetobacter pseudolwoffii]MDM1334742.1 hypothetical protein [Acinetobacter pseudolwoffii]